MTTARQAIVDPALLGLQIGRLKWVRHVIVTAKDEPVPAAPLEAAIDVLEGVVRQCEAWRDDRAREVPPTVATRPDTGIRVEITERHMDMGVPGDCWRCASSLAIAEALGLEWFEVWVDEAIVCLPGIAVWRTPPELQRFIAEFDQWPLGGPRPSPVAFSLGEPERDAWCAASRRGLLIPEVHNR
jgi:hypothetical protein